MALATRALTVVEAMQPSSVPPGGPFSIHKPQANALEVVSFFFIVLLA